MPFEPTRGLWLARRCLAGLADARWRVPSLLTAFRDRSGHGAWDSGAEINPLVGAARPADETPLGMEKSVAWSSAWPPRRACGRTPPTRQAIQLTLHSNAIEKLASHVLLFLFLTQSVSSITASIRLIISAIGHEVGAGFLWSLSANSSPFCSKLFGE